MKEDQDRSTLVYGRSPTRDKLECGCEVNSQARIDRLVSTRATRSRKGHKQEHGYVKLPKQWRNCLREDQAGVEDAGTEESKCCKENTRDCS